MNTFKSILRVIAFGIVIGALAPFAVVVPFEILLAVVIAIVLGSYVIAFLQDAVTIAVARLPRFTTIAVRNAQIGATA